MQGEVTTCDMYHVLTACQVLHKMPHLCYFFKSWQKLSEENALRVSILQMRKWRLWLLHIRATEKEVVALNSGTFPLDFHGQWNEWYNPCDFIVFYSMSSVGTIRALRQGCCLCVCGGEFNGKPTELLSNHGYVSYKVYILIPVGDGCSSEVSVYSC